ncbi:MAG: hypothetical protein KF805_01880 [Phycisphaeraceae bacterium]|nr:hypothetical protein [Phycisphaeraceae bacterium]
MIDQIFFAILLPLPIIVAIAALFYIVRAWRTSTPQLRRSRVFAAVWLGMAASILYFCRERVRGWTGFDVGSITIFMIASAGLLVLIAVAIGLHAAIGRSTRGVPLCPRCWYDMGGVEPRHDGGVVCPECGTRLVKSSDLLHRKRVPLLIAVAVAFQLAGQLSYQMIRADHGGAQNFVPTTVLIAGMFSLPPDSIIGPPSPFDFSTLVGRLANNRSADWQKEWAIGKAVGAIGEARNVEAISRAATILGRCQYEGEIPLEAWKSAVRLLCDQNSSSSGEAFSYLAECYVRARSEPDRSGRLSFATDPARCDLELRSLVPALLKRHSRSSVRTPEWWASLRLLALAGDAAEPVVPFLEERILFEESDSGRAYAGAVLAMLSPVLPDASDAALRSLVSLPDIEQPRVLNAIARYVEPSAELLPLFRALSETGEPRLETAGAVALLGGAATRCEGAERLIRVLRNQTEYWFPDLASVYWPVTRSPDDGASTILIVFLQELAMTSTPAVRVEAMGYLANIARDVDSRSAEILAFLDLVGTERNPDMAERARAFAADVRTSRSAHPVPRKVAIIR